MKRYMVLKSAGGRWWHLEETFNTREDATVYRIGRVLAEKCLFVIAEIENCCDNDMEEDNYYCHKSYPAHGYPHPTFERELMDGIIKLFPDKFEDLHVDDIVTANDVLNIIKEAIRDDSPRSK